MDGPLAKIPPLDPVNQAHLERYQRHLLLSPHLKPRTVKTKLWRTYTFMKAVKKDVNDLGREDVENWILSRRDKVEPITLMGEMLEVKLFLRFVGREAELFPEKIQRVKTTLPVDRLLTRKDITAIVEATTNQRDRCLVMLLWDSGCRISEALALRVGDIQFDQFGAACIVDGKTGRRRLRLISSAPELQKWIDIHPMRQDPDAPLFTTHRRYGSKVRPLALMTVENTIKTIGRRAGYPYIHPHLIRHARMTDMAKTLNEMELRIQAGWEKNSAMPAVYVHMSGGDVEKKLIRGAGLDDAPEEKITDLEAVQCPRCRAINAPGSMFCSRCFMALSSDAVRELEKLRNLYTVPDLLMMAAEELRKKEGRKEGESDRPTR
jgi:integrase